MSSGTVREGSPLRAQVALVTGASRGLGARIAAALAERGASVVLAARSAAALAAVQASLMQADRGHVAIACDLSETAAANRVVDAAVTRFGRLDILVNNAGTQTPIGSFAKVRADEYKHNLDVNLNAAALLMAAASQAMSGHGQGGAIVNVSGGGAASPRPNFAAYAASKAALVRLTETLAHELRDRGIRVNAMAPGALNTAMVDEVIAAGAEAGSEYDEARRRRARDDTKDFDRAVALALFLATAASAPLTGKLIAALHDPWDTWTEAQRTSLNASDWYTLRRIDPHTLGRLPAAP